MKVITKRKVISTASNVIGFVWGIFWVPIIIAAISLLLLAILCTLGPTSAGRMWKHIDEALRSESERIRYGKKPVPVEDAEKLDVPIPATVPSDDDEPGPRLH